MRRCPDEGGEGGAGSLARKGPSPFIRKSHIERRNVAWAVLGQRGY